MTASKRESICGAAAGGFMLKFSWVYYSLAVLDAVLGFKTLTPMIFQNYLGGAVVLLASVLAILSSYILKDSS